MLTDKVGLPWKGKYICTYMVIGMYIHIRHMYVCRFSDEAFVGLGRSFCIEKVSVLGICRFKHLSV